MQLYSPTLVEKYLEGNLHCALLNFNHKYLVFEVHVLHVLLQKVLFPYCFYFTIHLLLQLCQITKLINHVAARESTDEKN